MKKWMALFMGMAFAFGLIGCSNRSGKDFDKPEDLHQFDGTILEIHEDCFLVKPGTGMEELKSADQIEVSTQNADPSLKWKVGDLVWITYDGVILETDPARLNQVYKIEKTTVQFERESNNAPQKVIESYSFYGENETLKLADGSIVFEENNEMIHGGYIEILQRDLFADVSSYSTTFYTVRNNGERNDFHSTHVTGVRDGADSIHRDLGSSSSNGFTVVNLEQGLWFELVTTDVNGDEHTYLLELTVVKDVKESK